jgi:DNA-binding response OmpR family regulator
MRDATGRPTVLVVDDERLIRVMLVDILEAQGITCMTAANGEEALQVCEANRPDLIITDIIMPGVDGIETCRRLKANPAWASIPVIALTTWSDPESVIKMLDAGSLMYLTKPIAPERLVAAVRIALNTGAP